MVCPSIITDVCHGNADVTVYVWTHSAALSSCVATKVLRGKVQKTKKKCLPFASFCFCIPSWSGFCCCVALVSSVTYGRGLYSKVRVVSAVYTGGMVRLRCFLTSVVTRLREQSMPTNARISSHWSRKDWSAPAICGRYPRRWNGAAAGHI